MFHAHGVSGDTTAPVSNTINLDDAKRFRVLEAERFAMRVARGQSVPAFRIESKENPSKSGRKWKRRARCAALIL